MGPAQTETRVDYHDEVVAYKSRTCEVIMSMTRLLLGSISVFILIAITGCTIGTGWHTGVPDYSPDDSVLEKMTPREARESLSKIKPVKPKETIYDAPQFVGDKIIFRLAGSGKNVTVVAVPFLMAAPKVYCDNIVFGCVVSIGLQEGVRSGWLGWFEPIESAMGVADALYVLRDEAQKKLAHEEEEFAKSLDVYRQNASLGGGPEEGRRYSVQARRAIEEKNYLDAILLYREFSKIAPWVPSTHYNLSLIYVELGYFELGIVEMKRYLLLEPNAANASKVRDKIYEWERKVGHD